MFTTDTGSGQFVLRGMIKAHANDVFTSSLSNLNSKERESVKQALKQLGQMLAELAYRRA